MAISERTRRYLSAPPLAQRPRLELLPSPPLDWRDARNWLLPAMLFLSAIALYLLQASFATTSELEIAHLIYERDAIVRHNVQLAADIAELEKPARIRERAYALGLVDTTNSIKLNVRARAPDSETDPPHSTSADPPSLWQQWLNAFARWMSQSKP